MDSFEISCGRTTSLRDSKLIVDPYLHIENDHIYNPLTDRKFAQSETHYDKLKELLEGKVSVEGLPGEVRNLLRNNGWLVYDNAKLSRRFLLKYVSLEAHTVCNQACNFCPVSIDPRQNHYMPTEFYVRIVNQLASYKDTIQAVFMLNYNEPTIDPRFVEQVRTIKSHGLPPAVNTNASGFTPAKVTALIEMGGLRFLSVNLSTLDEEQYKKERGVTHLGVVLRNLDYIKDRQVAEEMDIAVLGEGDDRHLRNYEEIKQHFSGSLFNVKYFQVGDRAGYLRLGMHLTEPNKGLCGCDNVGSRPLQHLHITPTGKCVLCCEDYEQKYVVGDLNEQTVAEVLTSRRMQTLRRWIYGLEEAPDDFICRNCVCARSG